jgi:hypothetical protein
MKIGHLFLSILEFKKKVYKKGDLLPFYPASVKWKSMGRNGMHKKAKSSSKNAKCVFIRKKMDFGFFEDDLLFLGITFNCNFISFIFKNNIVII